MDQRSTITVRPPIHVYQCRRTESNTLDSTVRLGLQVYLSHKAQGILQGLYAVRCQDPISQAKDVRPRPMKATLQVEVLKQLIDVDIVYADFSLPCFYRSDEPEDEACTDGRMVMVPKPSVEVLIGPSVGLVDINVLPRTLPISSTHQGRPFRLIICIGQEEFLCTEPFFVLAKEISKESRQGHRPRGLSSKRTRLSPAEDDRINKLCRAVSSVAMESTKADFWDDCNRQLVTFIAQRFPPPPVSLDGPAREGPLRASRDVSSPHSGGKRSRMDAGLDGVEERVVRPWPLDTGASETSSSTSEENDKSQELDRAPARRPSLPVAAPVPVEARGPPPLMPAHLPNQYQASGPTLQQLQPISYADMSMGMIAPDDYRGSYHWDERDYNFNHTPSTLAAEEMPPGGGEHIPDAYANYFSPSLSVRGQLPGSMRGRAPYMYMSAALAEGHGMPGLQSVGSMPYPSSRSDALLRHNNLRGPRNFRGRAPVLHMPSRGSGLDALLHAATSSQP